MHTMTKSFFVILSIWSSNSMLSLDKTRQCKVITPKTRTMNGEIKMYDMWRSPLFFSAPEKWNSMLLFIFDEQEKTNQMNRENKTNGTWQDGELGLCKTARFLSIKFLDMINGEIRIFPHKILEDEAQSNAKPRSYVKRIMNRSQKKE